MLVPRFAAEIVLELVENEFEFVEADLEIAEAVSAIPGWILPSCAQ